MNAFKERKRIVNIYDLEKYDGHVEMIDGSIAVEDYTSPQHNIVVRNIAESIQNYLDAHDAGCIVFTDSVALLCDEIVSEVDDRGNYFLPDVMAVCPPMKIDRHGVHSVPRFVAEVTSESTKSHDYCEKMIVYKNIGVGEYWIVDLQQTRITTFAQDDGFVPQYFMRPAELSVRAYPGLVIKTNDFWQ